MTAPRLVTVKDVAAMTTLAESTLFDWRAKGKGPRSFKFGARVVYVEADVLEWIAAQQAAEQPGDKSPGAE
jgi:predicted DNA-binding transcriptional regulator AlpA